jgi:hypothetical protein
VSFARLVGETLLVELAYNGYAALSGGRNGYLAAYDVTTGRVRWVSPALSANGVNFVVLGRSVITGYGFTAESDFISNFDLDTGALLQRLPIKSGPDFFSVADRTLFVRTYDHDYAFSIEGAAAITPDAPALDAGRARVAAALDPNTPCHVQAAMAAIDARDASALSDSREALRADPQLPAWLSTALEAATPFVHALVTGQHPDLWRTPPLVIAAPPWQRTLVATTAPAPRGPTPKLRPLSAAKADPVRAFDPPPFRADRPAFIAPVDEGRRPPGAPNVPSHYGLHSLRAIIPSGEHVILIYGGRYVAVLRGQSVERVFDLGALRDPPKADPQWKEFTSQDATYAQVVGGTLYVCNGGGSYARDVFGKKGFLTAIDLDSGALRWRSDALRCNATFAIHGDHLLTGYGFTDEPDYLYALRLADGVTVEKARLASGPDSVTLDAGRIHVETYDHVYDFSFE